MDTRTLLSIISRNFLIDRKVCKYHMKKVADMSEDEVIQCCHWYCEANRLTTAFRAYRDSVEGEYLYCNYLREYIDEGLCYDVQMIAFGYIKPAALPEYTIDREAATACCNKCRHGFWEGST